MYKKTQVVFFVFHFEQLYIYLMNALVYVQNEKRKKLRGFSYYYKNIANFDAFLLGIKLSANLLFLKSDD